MFNDISVLKGIHPGIVLDRKLKERRLAKGRFALSINEYPQTLSAIIQGKRGMNTALSLKIEQALDLEEGYLMILQVFYDIKEERGRHGGTDRPNFARIRKGLFWDTDISQIDWRGQRRAVIERVLERGNDQEKEEIRRFYGESTFGEIAGKLQKHA